ncbi:F-box protein SKIP24 isoform X2 [Macadamia integrifolia]|uniref:F-box protein SKIP24 isoform X2 n=1 Tax=Macadamia integrifolia TaxID=60698 RepID=UPI001C4E84D3|nr:F-box protein SKIP24 isoform X2 [Macadamia integrifolia]
MSVLPDEIWRRILELGIENSKLDYKDLCCISISCRRLNRLSSEDAFWSTLLSLDFPQRTDGASRSMSLYSPSKNLYMMRFEKDKARKLAAHQRALLRLESQVAVHAKSLKDIRLRLMEESERMKTVAQELSNSEKIRQASVALNVWQPEIIRGRQKQIVEQCGVPINSRIAALEMELRLCKQQISALDKAYQRRLDVSKEELSSLKYHPLRDYKLTGPGRDECNMKRKKLNGCSK